MTDIAKTVLDTYQIRKTKKQKTKFIEYVTDFAEKRGYACHVEKGTFGARNIVVGSPDTASVIYTAHYDTCPVLLFPNFITPKKIIFYLLYQLFIVVVAISAMLAAGFGLGWLVGALASLLHVTDDGFLFLVSRIVGLGCYVALLALLVAGPANRHTANDNTSGVVTLLTVMDQMPEADRNKVACVFFDLEETGLFGSASFASKHKVIRKNTLLINFDCVSDGKRILLAVQKGARHYVPLLEKSFSGDERFSVEVRSKGVFYPSDQMNFKCGVGVASLTYSKWLRTEYMDRIHTGRDVIFEEENIAFLADCAVSLVGQMVNA